jgi:hypothetical protein
MGHQIDVEVTARFHKLRTDNAHGTVVGGEGLVQLGHLAADGRLAFHQIDFQSALGQVQGGLDAGDAAPDHHHGTRHVTI